MRRRCMASLMVSVFLVGACELTEGERTDPQPTPTIATSSIEARVLNDFGVLPAVPDSKLETVNDPSIDVGKGKVGIFAVERPEIAGRCLVAAQLRLYLQRATERISTELAIYSSHVFNAHTKRAGDRFGYSGSALDIRPRANLDEDVANGWSAWDVTDIVRRWLSRRPFPSMGLRASKRGPIVFTLRDVDGAGPFARATVASAESGNAPHMIVTHHRDCDE